MDTNKEAKKYLNKYFKAQYLKETDDEYKSLVRLLNKALREQLFCSMVGKGFCPYESKDGKCTMLDKCVNHTTK